LADYGQLRYTHAAHSGNPFTGNRVMHKMYRVVLLLALALLSACDQPDRRPPDTGKMVKAVHYFADAWPKTFWQEFEVSQIDADIQRIKEDGFNTVILAVPWMGFESNFEARRTRSDPRMYQRLELLLQKIGDAGLSYILRVGFPHDFTPGMDTDSVQLCLGMYAEERTLDQWTDYGTARR
jgi:hypothetical protein